MPLKLATALVTSLGLAVPAFAADIVVGVPNWPSVTVTANVIKEIFEKNLGLTVELQIGTNPVIVGAMDKGAMNIHPEVWLPNQQGLCDQYATRLEMNGHPTSAAQGICVNKAAVPADLPDILIVTCGPTG